MLLFLVIFTPRLLSDFTQFKTSSDSNRFLTFVMPIHWLAKINALIDRDLSPGIFIDLLNLFIFPFTKREVFSFILFNK